MSETQHRQHDAQSVEQFQSALKLYTKEREVVIDAKQVRDGYKRISQAEEELNNSERQPLFDAAAAENTMRDRFPHMKEEMTELAYKYMKDGRYMDAMDLLNNLMEWESLMGSLIKDSYDSSFLSG